MRLQRPRATALLFLLPALQAVATSLGPDTDDKPVARAAVPAYTASAFPDPSLAPSSSSSKGTKDAPVDGLDGLPHAGPYVNDDPKVHDKQPNVVQDLGKKPTSSPAVQLGPDNGLSADDSVMQDPDRKLATGNRGTGGGVSAKDKERLAHEEKTGEKMEKVPEAPKEAPPHPADHKQLNDGSLEATSTARILGAAGLEKPTDLPDSLHDNPLPVPDNLSDKDHLDTLPPKTPAPGSLSDSDAESGVIQPFHSFILSFTMIIFSEIGDKTFLVAALMAMRHPRLLVFSAAFSALVVMTVLSAVLGHAVPTLLSERFTHFAAAALFLVFGVKLIREGLAMSPDEGVGEEMREVEQELEEKEQLARHHNGHRKTPISPYALESGRVRRSRSNSRLPAPARSPSSSPDRSPSPRGGSFGGAVGGLNNLFSLLLSPAWVQTFVMTFLGEWGDRSQIATVAMAAGSDYWWVTAGAVVGHGLCTAGAVIGGRAIAGKISMRNGMRQFPPNKITLLTNHSHSGWCSRVLDLRNHISVGGLLHCLKRICAALPCA